MEKKLNSNHLKIIAIIAMTIDHAANLFYPSFPAQPLPIALHIIGRLTAPIMWFFIAEGYHYTHNIKKYLLRLGIFAIISHFAYCFAFGINFVPLKTGIFNQTSVMYPLFIAVLVLWLQDSEFRYKVLKHILIFVIPRDSSVPVHLSAAGFAVSLKTCSVPVSVSHRFLLSAPVRAYSAVPSVFSFSSSNENSSSNTSSPLPPIIIMASMACPMGLAGLFPPAPFPFSISLSIMYFMMIRPSLKRFPMSIRP